MRNNQKFIRRLLEERSHLTFEFPTEKGLRRAYLPFLENPQINEKQKASLTAYNLLSRNSSIFSYGGATSREFEIKFNISLPLLVELSSKDGLSPKFTRHFLDFNVDKETLKETFTKKGNIIGIDNSDIQRKYYFTKTIVDRDRAARFQRGGAIGIRSTSVLNTTSPYDASEQAIEPYKKQDRNINLMLFWINLVRGSTKNNSIDTTFGPPIIRLNHGTMYNNVPCVADNYSISIDEAAGYDIETLNPKRVSISLSLKESRTGDFDTYIAKNKVKGDNNTGWESIFYGNEMDPYNGLITDDDSALYETNIEFLQGRGENIL